VKEMKTTKETESMIRSMPKPVVVVFHGYESSIEHERYQNIPFEIRGQTIDYSSLSFEEIKTIYNQIIDELIAEKKDIILLGHSLGGWWARYFAKKRKMEALLLNPVLFVEDIDLSVDKAYYIRNQYPIEYSASTALTYYLEMGDELLNFEPYINDMKKEGRIVSISGGHHRIKYTQNIYDLLKYISNEVV